MTDPRGSECACVLCGATFTGLTLFDAHQDVDYTRQQVIICRDPAALGLAQDARGTWGTPEGLRARERSATLLAAARSARAQANTPKPAPSPPAPSAVP
jgi:hypothetical protein